MSFECPVLKELRLTEDYDPEFEQKPHLTGGDYDIDAIRDCGENCKLAMLYTALSMDVCALKRENARLRGALEHIRDADYRGHPCSCAGIARAALEASSCPPR